MEDYIGRMIRVEEHDSFPMRASCRPLKGGAFKLGAQGYVVAKPGLNRALNFCYPKAVKRGQVVVCTVPKCGTTLMLEMAWLISNRCDFDGARSRLDCNRHDYLGGGYVHVETPEFKQEYYRKLWTNPSCAYYYALIYSQFYTQEFFPSKLVKTHVPISLLNPHLLEHNKVIYVARNPKDAICSYYRHFHNALDFRYEGSLEDMAVDYMNGRLLGLPFFPHVLEAWRLRHHRNMLFLFYEEIVSHMSEAVRTVADFLGQTISENQVQRLCNHLSFDNMKSSAHVNQLLPHKAGILDPAGFFGPGVVGSSKQALSAQTIQLVDDWIARSTLGTDFSFPTC